ncbi:hypothetical protein RFI_10407 [Reticulomyxa filosa]|uniref:ODAD1 central coiled coil region domain-containing protein n=1 Tax=Reticulomyxa filosa TaxID=46433 RepID=X6NL55_RETFI|nr:hypothetical protein RFI_10407 [Reticulomyxa filosa]|eukprot:ETO26726.1 hypothetical protein RFI_10407 [Reticulomyxa filosa]
MMLLLLINSFKTEKNYNSLKLDNRVDQTQTELDALQRQFRDMEARHRTMNDDSVQTMRMQRQKIEKLRRDNDKLKEELAIETRQECSLCERKKNKNKKGGAKIALTNRGAVQLSNLREQGESYESKIEMEKRRIFELDQQIKKNGRNDMGGINANRETSRTIQKNIRMLENRLDKALIKYNEALGYNKKLRETIDNLRRERVVFDGIYRKLETDLEQIKTEMVAIIESANQAYEQRDHAQTEMLRIKEQADKLQKKKRGKRRNFFFFKKKKKDSRIEQKQFEHEWKELSKLIDQDKKTKDFLNSKDRDNVNDALANNALQQEQQLKKRLSKGAWAIVKDRAHIQMAQERVKSYEEAFHKITEATGISDIDELVKTFMESEESNFQLFNQVNNISTEIERLEESIANLNKEINKTKNGGGTGTNQKNESSDQCSSAENQRIGTNKKQDSILRAKHKQAFILYTYTFFFKSNHH